MSLDKSWYSVMFSFLQKIYVFLGVFCFVLLPFTAQAQNTNIEQIIDQGFSQPAPEPATPTDIDTPDLSLDAPEGAENVTFFLKDLTIENVTAFKEAELKSTYADLLDQDISLKDLYNVANKITSLYRNNGYILSVAIIPEQDVTEGQATIEVIEGYISNVTYEGLSTSETSTFDIHAQNLKASRPLHIDALESFVFRLNDFSGLDVEVILKRSETEFGGTDLVLVSREKKVSGGVTINNRGSRAIGSFQGLANVQINSLVKKFDTLSLQFATASQFEELLSVSGEYRLPIYNNFLGLRLGGQVTTSEPGDDIEAFDFETETESFFVGFDAALYRTRNLTATLIGDIGFRRSRSEILNSLASKDRITKANLGLSIDSNDTLLGGNKPASSTVSLLASAGLDLFDASRSGDADLSRANGDGQFFTLQLDASRYQNIANNLYLQLATRGQIASEALLSSEEISFGGSQFGRGFIPSEITGDHGIGASLQLDYWTSSKLIPQNIRTKLYGFYDIATVRNVETLPGASRSDSLASAGIGAQAIFPNGMNASLELAKPLTRDRSDDGDQDLQILFDVGYNF